jgi:hypothetical protein
MPRISHHRARILFQGLILCLLLGVFCVGCDMFGGGGGKKAKQAAPPVLTRYQDLPKRDLPDFLRDTILDRCELQNAQPFVVSGYGLVSSLRGSGDTTAPNAVLEFMRREMIRHQFGSRVHGTEAQSPERILRDPNFAIVRVDALIPPGARRNQRIDVLVSAIDGNNTQSLASGILYQSDLKVDGANRQRPGYKVEIWATSEGSIFVNPAYALRPSLSDPTVRNSLRQGRVLNGGLVMMDRPLVLRLRKPQLSISRAIERRIDQALQNPAYASAKNEGVVAVNVPERYNGDWERFAQVIMHLFLDSSPEFAAIKAQQLAAEAVKPDAPLLDISYCWEGLGATILPVITPLMTHEKPDVAFAAARAAVLLGDSAAEAVLIEMARRNGHPFQVSAVQTLAKLPSSPVINQMLRTLLDVDQTLVRIEAYRALAANNDSSIISRPIGERFVLDSVRSQGPPIIYVSRTGTPRIAVIGNRPHMDLPAIFSAMDHHLTIASERDRPLLNVFYRDEELPEPVSFLSSPDLEELIARLGGEGPGGQRKLPFDYCEVVAILQAMSSQGRLSATVNGGVRMPVAFVLEEGPRVEQAIEEAPAIPEMPPEAPKISDTEPVGTVLRGMEPSAAVESAPTLR